MPPTPTPLVFRNLYALGDTVCFSAFIRDLELAHPGRFRISVVGNFRSYWKHFPMVRAVDPQLRAPVLDATYKEGAEAAHAGRYRHHFLTWFHHALGKRLKLAVPVTAPHGLICLPAGLARPVPGRYWVVVAGGKTDMTAKWWSFAHYQTVVDRLAAAGIACVQAGANFQIHVHAKLANCRSLVGQTDDIVDLFNLIRHSDGVICGITAAMHIAAALGKPCVVVAGGREEPSWEAYTNHGQFPAGCPPVAVPHTFLHTVGQLDCCRTAGCWVNRTVPIEPADTASVGRRAKLCKDPVRGPQNLPRCLTLIEPRHVTDAVLGYYASGALPPLTLAPAADPAPAPPPPAALATHRAVPAEVRAGPILTEPAPLRILDHPALGGKVTLFLLVYGDHLALARQSFDGIFKSVPAARCDIRVALNQPGAATAAYFAGLARDGLVTKLYPDHGDRRKYPAMRMMFRDPDCPITTPYLVWFDDDTRVVDPLWLARLGEAIVANHKLGARLYGAPFLHDLALYARDGHRPDRWFRAASWWRGRDLRLRGHPGREAANGTTIPFVSGWFWALATELIALADIPDARLNHNGGDATIGEQVHQAGYKIASFNVAKKHVWCPPRDQGGRRGYSEPFPWSRPEVASPADLG